MFNIVLVGCGNLGLRYLSGIDLIKDFPITVFIADKDSNKFKKIDELGLKNLTTHTTSSIDNLPKIANLLIVATTAKKRAKLLSELIKNSSYEYIILEKILEQNQEGLMELESLLADHKNCYVNTPRRSFPIYKKLKFLLNGKKILSFERHGGRWGMLGNTIHYLDTLEWLTDTKAIDVDYNINKQNAYQTGRQGYYDYDGSITVRYEDGSSLLLSSDIDRHFKGCLIKLTNGMKIELSEKYQVISFNGAVFDGFEKISHESIIKHALENITNNQRIDMPYFSQSLNQHKILINNFFSNVT